MLFYCSRHKTKTVMLLHLISVHGVIMLVGGWSSVFENDKPNSTKVELHSWWIKSELIFFLSLSQKKSVLNEVTIHKTDAKTGEENREEEEKVCGQTSVRADVWTHLSSCPPSMPAVRRKHSWKVEIQPQSFSLAKQRAQVMVTSFHPNPFEGDLSLGITWSQSKSILF